MSPRLPCAFASIVLFITTVVLSQSSIASAAAPAINISGGATSRLSIVRGG